MSIVYIKKCIGLYVCIIFSAILGDTAIVSGQEEDLHLSDDEEMDVNDSESSPVCTILVSPN